MLRAISELELKKSQKLLNNVYREQVRSLNLYDYLDKYDFKDLPVVLLGIPGFKNFVFSSLVVLKKGTSLASLYESTNKVGNLNSESFNKVFNTVRKAKRRIFESSQPNIQALNIPGKFLAHAFATQDIQGIITLSRCDFLDPLLFETNLFKKFCQAKGDAPSINLIHPHNEEFHLLKSLAATIFEKIHIKKNDIDILQKNADTIAPHSDLWQHHNGYDIFAELPYQNRIEQAADTHHQQRIKLMGELFNTLKHELSNPIFGIKIYTEVISQQVKPELQDIIGQLKNSIERCELILEDLGKMYIGHNQFTEISLNKTIEQALTLAKSEIRSIIFSIEWDLKDEVFIYSHSSFIIQILFNLVTNACSELKSHYQSNPEKAKLHIQIQHTDDKQYTQITVHDNGSGIKKGDETMIFHPFFTTKSSGTGLGLAISRKLAKQIGGELFLDKPLENMSTAFTLKLPLKAANFTQDD